MYHYTNCYGIIIQQTAYFIKQTESSVSFIIIFVVKNLLPLHLYTPLNYHTLCYPNLILHISPAYFSSCGRE